MQAQLVKIKELFDEKRYSEVLDSCITVLNKQNRNKIALTYLMQAQVELELFNEARNTINAIQGLLTQEDGRLQMLIFQSIRKMTQKQQNQPGLNKKMLESIRLEYKQVLFRIIDLHSNNNRVEKMLEEMEEYLIHLFQDESYREIEDNLLWVFNHQGLTAEQRLDYGCRIFNIDKYYNPYTKIDDFFASIYYNLVKDLKNSQDPNLLNLAQKVLEFLEKKNWKKEVGQVLSQGKDSQVIISEFQKYLSIGVPATKIIFAENPMKMLCQGSQSVIQNLGRALGAQTFTLQLFSEEWDTFINQLSMVTQIDAFKATIGDLELNPLQIFIHAILDIARILKSKQVPDHGDTKADLFFLKTFANREDGVEILTNFCREYSKISPFVGLYTGLCISCLNWCPTRVKIDQTMEKLNLVSFLQRNIQKNKLGVRDQKADPNFILFILYVRFAEQLDQEERHRVVQQQLQNADFVSKYSSPEMVLQFKNEHSKILWKSLISEGNWQDSITEIEKIAEVDQQQKNWAKMTIAWIQYSFLNRLAKNVEERKLFLTAIYNQLNEVAQEQDTNSDALLMQGFLLFMHDAQSELGLAKNEPKACLNKWLLALKRNQTDPNIFYSLALYYFFRESNQEKAKKCLDKALLLKPDFEEAFLLQYCILCKENNYKDAILLVDKMQQVNRNLASTYYLRGISLINQGDYIQAIDNLQNATRFYSIKRANRLENEFRAPYPSPEEIRDANLPLFNSKLGLFGCHKKQLVNVWVHLILCFQKIDKPTVSIKCAARAMQEIGSLLNSTSIEKLLSGNSEENDQQDRVFMQSLVSCCENFLSADRQTSMESSDPSNQEIYTNLKLLLKAIKARPDQTKMPSFFSECIECLTITASIVSEPNLAICLALAGLQITMDCKLKSRDNIQEALIAQVLKQAATKIRNGKVFDFGEFVCPTWLQNQIQIILNFIDVSSPKFQNSLIVQKNIINVYFTVSNCLGPDQSEQKRELIRKCITKVEQLIINEKLEQAINEKSIVHGPYSRSLLVDASKIYHKAQALGIDDEEIIAKKLKYARQAIILNPNNSHLWVHFHLFLDDKTPESAKLKAQAIFKAYEIDSDDAFVQEILLKYYMSSPQTYKKAFMLIVKWMHKAHTRQEEINPVIHALLAYLNSKVLFHTGNNLDCLSGQEQQSQKKIKILEAVSLINLIKGTDLMHMFFELMTFLQHMKGAFSGKSDFGPYIVSCKQLEMLINKQKNGQTEEETLDTLKLILFEDYFCSGKLDKDQLSQMFEGKEGNKVTEIMSKIRDDIFNVENLGNEVIKSRTESLIQDFVKNPQSVCSRLILLQEICLTKDILPDLNILDMDDNISQILETLSQNQQRTLLVQSLVFCQRRDGEIKQEVKVVDSQEEKKVDDSEQVKEKCYTKFVIMASRFKPASIDSMPTHKDLLRLYLASRSDPQLLLKGKFKSVPNPNDKTSKGLDQMVNVKKQRLLFAQKQVMRNPLSLNAHVAWIWSLIYNAKLTDAENAIINLLKDNQKKFNNCTKEEGSIEKFEELNNFIKLVRDNSQDIQISHKLKVTADLVHTKQSLESEESKEDFKKKQGDKIDNVAIGVVKTILSSTDMDKAWPMLVSRVTYFLQTLLFQKRQFTLFNKVIDKILNVVASLSPEECPRELVSHIWAFQCLNKVSSLIEMKKVVSCVADSATACNVLKNGFVIRDPLPANLLHARSYQLLKNDAKAANILESTDDQALLSKDIITALGLYAQQAYKQFYLAAIGLVAGCKAKVEKTKDKVAGDEKQQSYFMLGYAYYLKAYAECTFMAARKQGITLQEDFDEEEDADSFDFIYFLKKAKASLTKSKKALIKAGDKEGDLMQAIHQISQQL